MKPVAKLLHQTYTTYLPTAFPAHFYGMPDGRVYLIFSRFYEAGFGNSGLEFVFAIHKEFSYNYDNGTIMHLGKKKKQPVFAETVNKPNPKIEILKIQRDLNSYGEAERLLNLEADEERRYA